MILLLYSGEPWPAGTRGAALVVVAEKGSEFMTFCYGKLTQEGDL